MSTALAYAPMDAPAMTLRAELLAAAVAHRERCARLADQSLRHIALYEWDRHVSLLAGGGDYRVTRGELPPTHPDYEFGVCRTVLVLVGDDELRPAA